MLNIIYFWRGKYFSKSKFYPKACTHYTNRSQNTYLTSENSSKSKSPNMARNIVKTVSGKVEKLGK